MPYYISNEMSDCAGWATIKADSPDATPETIGCHQTKQDAIDQMVAVSLSEDVEYSISLSIEQYFLSEFL